MEFRSYCEDCVDVEMNGVYVFVRSQFYLSRLICHNASD